MMPEAWRRVVANVLLSAAVTCINFAALIFVEARNLPTQGWLLIGVVRHVLSWPILQDMLAFQYIATLLILTLTSHGSTWRKPTGL